MPSSFRLDARTETALTSCSVVALTFLPSRACRRSTTSGSEDLSEGSVLVNELISIVQQRVQPHSTRRAAMEFDADGSNRTVVDAEYLEVVGIRA